MLQINNLYKTYGAQIIFDGATLQMAGGERLGLMGRNGSGKTTLFRMILGKESPDGGSIDVPRQYRIGYLEQHLNFKQPTVLEEACQGFSEEAKHEEYRAEEILFGLGFSKEDLARSPHVLSGGFQVRLQLGKTLLAAPNLLLLDEPTNYLDIVAVRWITRFLKAWKDELIVISHDREFMDSVTTHTAIIHRNVIRKMKGDAAKLCDQIAEEEEVYEKTRVNEDRRREQLLSFIERFKAKNTKASAAKSKMKMLEKMPEREKLTQLANLDFRFHFSPFPAKIIMEATDLSFSYNPDAELISGLSFRVSADDRIAVIGKNGKGKSTLLKLLSDELKPTQGSCRLHPSAKIGYFGQTNIDRLTQSFTVEEEIASVNCTLTKTSVRGICGTMMFSGDSAEKKVAVLSGGEKSRVLLGKILAAPANLLLLDEPSNHLDMQSIEALCDSIDEFAGAVIIVTHDEMILRRIATKLILFQGGNAQFFDGTYDEFLEKVGWEDERDLRAVKKEPDSAGAALSKKDIRRLRSQIIQERSSMLGPLKQKIEAVERDICNYEKEIERIHEELIAASREKQSEKCAQLSIELKQMQAKIDELFIALEKTSLEHDRLLKMFEERLRDIEGDRTPRQKK